MFTVDRIEGTIAVVETEDGMINVGLSSLPDNVREGDILIVNSNGKYEIDVEETKRLRARIKKLEDELFK